MMKYKCPICKTSEKKNRSWTACPRNDKPICLRHCFEACKYLNQETSVTRCTYRQDKEREKEHEKNTLP